jgi:hypothetical protein
LSWTRYRVTLEFDDRIVGGVPAHQADTTYDERRDAVESWLSKQTGEKPPPEGLVEEVMNDPDIPTVEIGPLNTFKRDDDALYIEARQVKAMLREGAQRLGIIAKKRGSRQVIQHDLHVVGQDKQKIRLCRAGVWLQEPDGVDERPISVMTRQGPRTAIKRFEYVTEPTITFTVQLLAGGIGDKIVSAIELKQMMELGGWLGLGADRSQGAGMFTVVSVDLLTEQGDIVDVDTLRESMTEAEPGEDDDESG